MATTVAVLHLFWRWNHGTDNDGVTFINWFCSLATVRSIKRTYMHVLVLLSLFLAPMLETLMTAGSLSSHMEAEQGKNSSRLEVVIPLPWRHLFRSGPWEWRAMGSSENTIFRFHFLESAAVSSCQPCEWSHFTELAKCITHSAPHSGGLQPRQVWVLTVKSELFSE